MLKKWLTLAIVGILFALLGITYAWLQEPAYKAKLTFSFETGGDNKLGSYAGIAAQLGFDIGGSGSASAYMGDNLIEFLKTRNIVEQTLLTANPDNGKLMIDQYLDNHNLKKGWDTDTILNKIVFSPNQAPQRERDSIIGKVYANIIKKQLEVEKLDKKLSFVEVRMQDNNEMFAKKFIELLTDNAIKNYINYRLSKSKKNLELVQQHVDSVKGVLYGGITDVAATNDLNINPSKQAVRTGVQKKQVDIQTATIVYGELLKNLEIAKLTVQRETPLVQVIDKPKLPLEKKKPGRLLTGIIFAFIGCFLTSIYLIVFKKSNTALVQSIA